MATRDRWAPRLEWAYRYRWIAAALTLAAVLVATAVGANRMGTFSAQVDALKDSPSPDAPPRLFDQRTDIWFAPEDEGLLAYRDIEDQFIAEDIVIIAFEEADDPWGVFGERSLETIARLSRSIEKVPYVRAVRSLTDSPWIRWAEVAPSEEGLVVDDFFDGDVAAYSEEQRLERMVAILGADRAAALVGEQNVRRVIGDDPFSDHIGEPRFVNSIVSADGRTAAIQVQVLRQKPTAAAIEDTFAIDDEVGRAVGPVLSSIEGQGQALAAIRDILAAETHYELHLAGIPVLEQHFPEVGMHDMAFIALMFLGIGSVLFFVFRRVGGVALPMVVVVASTMGMLGTVWALGDLINNLTATAPVVMTAVGVADAVHLVTAYYLLKPRYGDRRALIIEVVRRNALPVLLTSITTSAAFFSLMVSAIVPVKMFGYTAGIGTLLAYALSMTVVPALLSLLPVSSPSAPGDETLEEGPEDDEPHWSDPLLDVVIRRRGIVLAGAAVLAGVAFFGMSRVAVESDMRLMFPDDDPVSSDIRWLEGRLGGAGDLDIVFYGPPLEDESEAVFARQRRIEALQIAAADGLDATDGKELEQLQRAEADHQRRRIASSAAFLRQVDAFERRLDDESADPGSPLRVLTSFDSGLSVLRRMHQVQNENASSHYRVPVARDVPDAARRLRTVEDDVTGEVELLPAQTASTLSAQYYLQYENGAKPTQNLSNLVTQDRRGFRIAARVSSASSKELLEAYDRIRAIARDEFPALSGTDEAVASGQALSTMRMSGKHYLFINMLERFSETLIVSMLIALGVITLVIVVVFRSVTIGLVSMIPNVLPLVVPLGFLGIVGAPLDGPAVIVASVALGVCVDDTIHLLTKFRAGQAEGRDVDGALRHAFRRVGSAVTWTTVVLVVGFAALGFSAFRPNMMIGVLGAAMVLLAWVADLVVTPAALSLLERRREAAPISHASAAPATG